jgi:hypothetical protein
MFIREGTPRGFKTISTGVPSGRKGISSSGRIFGNNPLIPVATGHFVAFGDFSLLGNIHPHDLVDAGRKLIAVLPGKNFTSTIFPASPWGTRKGVSLTSRAFSPKMALSRRSSAVSSVSPLG